MSTWPTLTDWLPSDAVMLVVLFCFMVHRADVKAAEQRHREFLKAMDEQHREFLKTMEQRHREGMREIRARY